jgi:hypothetical protein
MLSCPSVFIRCLALRKAGVPQGYAVISLVGGQGRVADVRIASKEDEDWRAALSAIVRVLSNEPGICEIAVIGSIPPLRRALEANGFHLRQNRPVLLLDPGGKLAGDPLPQLGMLEDDASFLYDPEWPYLT